MMHRRGRVVRGALAALVVVAGSFAGRVVAVPVVADFERYGRQADAPEARLESGLLLLGELGCGSCHAAGDAATQLLPKTAPLLDAVGIRLDPEWLAAYLAAPHAADPGTTMPDLLAGLDADVRAATVGDLVHHLAASGPFDSQPAAGSEDAQPREGAAIYARVGCAVCHGPLSGTALADQHPLGDLTAKWSPAALDAFLRDPHAVRPAGRMPRLPLDDNERKHLVAALVAPPQVRDGSLAATEAFRGSLWRKGVDRLAALDDLGPPDARGLVRGFGVEAFAGQADNFVVRLEGFFHAPVAGAYQFLLASDDGSRLFVAGREVVAIDGIHPRVARGGTVELPAGVHAIRVEYFEGGGESVLDLEVTPPRRGRRSALAFVTPESDGTPAAADDEPEPPAFAVDESRAARGRAAFVSLGCAACHAPADREAAEARRGPDLARLAGATGGCLADEPAPGLPRYGLDAEQRQRITAALAFLATPAAAEPPGRERAIERSLATFNCRGCHVRDGRGGVLPAVRTVDEDGEPVLRDELRDRLFTSPIQEIGDEGRLPPTLDGVGDKLRPEFLTEVLLQGGVDRRPTMHTRMPAFVESAARPLADRLAADPHTSVALPELARFSATEVHDRGRELVGSKGLGCIKCHSFRGDRGQGLGVIDMTRFPHRLRHEWFLAYVADPQRFRPGTRMPAAWPDGKVFFPAMLDGTAAGQIEAVWRYLALDKQSPPLGLGNDPIELVATDRPVLYRNFIEGAGPRGIGVGYPEKVNLAWDAEVLRLALVWRGSFIDARRHWSGRGEGWQPPMGDGVFTPDAAAAIEVLDAPDAAWPEQPPRRRGARFTGYRLDAAGRPAFSWTGGGLTVRESFVPLAAPDRGFHRTIDVEAPRPVAGATFRAAVAQTLAERDGWFVVDGGWRLRISEGGTPVRREAGGRTELRYPLRWSTADDGTARARIEEDLSW